MVQIYKSEIVDLLRADDEPIKALRLEYDHDGSVSIRNLYNHQAKDFLQAGGDKRLIKIINKGLDNRLMRSTQANEASSRSHLLCAITIAHRD